MFLLLRKNLLSEQKKVKRISVEYYNLSNMKCFEMSDQSFNLFMELCTLIRKIVAQHERRIHFND